MILNDGTVSDVNSICESFVEFFRSVYILDNDSGTSTNDIIVESISTELSQISQSLRSLLAFFLKGGHLLCIQGKHLATFLFILFINDVVSCFKF